MPIEVHPDAEALARVAAERIIDAVRAGARRLLLAGGSTPARTYELLARLADPADLRGVHLFFGDERAVPADHADSNYGMVKPPREMPVAGSGVPSAAVPGRGVRWVFSSQRSRIV